MVVSRSRTQPSAAPARVRPATRGRRCGGDSDALRASAPGPKSTWRDFRLAPGTSCDHPGVVLDTSTRCRPASLLQPRRACPGTSPDPRSIDGCGDYLTAAGGRFQVPAGGLRAVRPPDRRPAARPRATGLEARPRAGRTALARVSSMTRPSRRCCCPVTSVVLRRSRRTGVLSCRCAALSRQHAAATSMPAGPDRQRVDEVAGERGKPAPRQREPDVVVEAATGELEVVGRHEELHRRRRAG